MPLHKKSDEKSNLLIKIEDSVDAHLVETEKTPVREFEFPNGFFVLEPKKGEQSSPSLLAMIQVLFENEFSNGDIQIFLYKMFGISLKDTQITTYRRNWKSRGALTTKPRMRDATRELLPKARDTFTELNRYFSQIAADEQNFYANLRRKADLQLEQKIDSEELPPTLLQKVSRDLFDREQILKTQPIRIPVLSELSNDELAQQLVGTPVTGTVITDVSPATSADGVGAA